MTNTADLISTFTIAQNKLSNILPRFDLKKLQTILVEYDHELNNPSIWTSNPKKATKISKERNDTEILIKKIQAFKSDLEIIEEFKNEGMVEEVAEQIYNLSQQTEKFELETFLSAKEDKLNAIVSIHAGAGGTEAMDWTGIVYRMYVRWATKNGFAVETQHEEFGEGGYLSSVSFKVSGDYAYGLLKNENGVHRLVRNSPFDSDFAVHTSFTGVEVLPEVDDSIDIKIDDKDVEVTAIRGSGAGGQNVNKVSSCIRLKHIPTGIQIVSRSERDQLKNKNNAFDRLKAMLYKMELDKRQVEIDKKNAEKQAVNFGSQIRSYVLSGHQVVNDHRTGVKNNNSQSVLDGNIDDFIKGSLYNVK